MNNFGYEHSTCDAFNKLCNCTIREPTVCLLPIPICKGRINYEPGAYSKAERDTEKYGYSYYMKTY